MPKLIGKYTSHEANTPDADGTVSRIWATLVDTHKGEFPTISECVPGTFNVLISDPGDYFPPDDKRYRELSTKYWKREEGHHISPVAKITHINDKKVECWIYRGGHADQPILELLSKIPLASTLGIAPNQMVTLLLKTLPEGSPGMPDVPGSPQDNNER